MAGPQPDQLVKMLQESQDVITALERHDIIELFKKMLRMSLVPASQKYLFNSLDLDRLDSELKVRYLLRLVCVKIREDGSVWDKFLKLMTKIGHQELSDNLSKIYTHKSSHPLLSKQAHEAIVFGLQDVKLLLGLLVEVSHKWERVGLAFGLPKYKIEACRGNDNVISLSNILTCWIRADDNIPAKTSLSRLKKALSGDIVGESRVALNLDKEVHKARQTDTPVLAKQVDSKPILSIVDQSYDTEVADGRATLLYVQASFTESVSYQWNKDGEPLANCCTYCGVEEDMLVITSARQGVQGNYTCCVSYQEQKVTSNDFTLTLIYTLEKKRLLNLYSVQSEVPKDSWPPVGTKTFINLVLIKKVSQQYDPKHYALSGDADKVIAQKEKERIEYSEVFGEYKSSELVLVEGRPGSGKTTLVHKIIKDWTNGLVLREADLVFLITLRFANKFTDEESPSNLYTQLKYRDEKLKAFTGEIERRDGEGVCFIVDGLDEYHCQDQDSSIVYQLLDKSYLSKSMVIVTSRPATAADLNESVLTKRIETFGFSKEQILEYIDNFPFSNSSLESASDCFYSTSLKEHLHSHPSIFNMCFLPVHAAMISFLYQSKGGNIPATQTKIYEEFTRSMILRHLRRQDKGIQISSLKELTGEAKKNFDALCFLAYSMSTRKVQVISREELSREFSLEVSSDDSWSLGLVTVNSTAQLSGMDRLYTFLHLTFQEFLSAYYIASLDTDKQVELFTTNSDVFLRQIFSETSATFLCGLVKIEGKEYLLHEVTSLFEDSLTVLFSMAFESQQQAVCDIIVELCKGEFDLDSNLSAMDLSSLEYVACATSKQITVIKIYHDIVQILQILPKNQFTGLVKLRIDDNILNFTQLVVVCDALKYCTNLKKLKLSFRGINVEDCQCVADVFHGLTSLQELSLCCTGFSEGIMSLLSGVQNILGLQLKLVFEDLGKGGVQEISGGLQLLSDVYITLVIVRNNLSLDDAMAFAEILYCHMKLLNFLKVKNNTISSLGAFIIASALQTPSSLTYLEMSHSNLDDEGAINVAVGMKFMPFLESLHLNDNSFGPEGATALGNEMQYLTELQLLDISCNNVGPCGARAIACGIARCTKLKELDMSKTNIDLDSATHIILSLKNSLIEFGDFSIDENIVLDSTFGVRGLIFPEDERGLINLKAAAQHPTCERTIDLGFDKITINPQLKK